MLALIVAWSMGSDALGNGMKFPQAAYPAMPSIPVQRAMIVHRDGVQTLVVESTYDTPSPSVGWVLPLPAEPTRLEAGDAGMLTSLAVSLRPRISHDLELAWKLPLFVLICALPIAIGVVSTRRRRVRLGCTTIAIGLMVTVVMVSLLLPPLGLAGGVAGVEISSTQRVGNYEVSVLRADGPEALSAWLTKNSLTPLPSKAIPIIEDYIARKWCFLVARLDHAAGGTATPHPICASFPSARPVYPMKLTSLAPGKTRVELFVVADKQASAEGFELIAADRYMPATLNMEGKGHIAPHYAGASTRLVIGHPDAAALLWNNCTVTRLSAEFTPEKMNRDIEMQLDELRPYRQHVYSYSARREVTWAIVLWFTVVWVLLAASFYQRGRKARKWERRMLIGLAAVALVAGAGARWLLPAVEVRTSGRMHPKIVHMRMAMLTEAAADLNRAGVLHAKSTPEDVARFAQIIRERKLLAESWVTNPLTGKRMEYERAPGNFASRVIDGTTNLCLYDAEGREMRYPLWTLAATRAAATRAATRAANRNREGEAPAEP